MSGRTRSTGKDSNMNSDEVANLEEIGINADQIEPLEKFLEALEAGREVTFTQTSSGSKLETHEALEHDKNERSLRASDAAKSPR